MRRLALIGLFLPLSACGSVGSPYLQANTLMGQEIENRVRQIPFQHRDELYQNLLWLAQSGEQAIPDLIEALGDNNPKVRSSCAWVLGRIGDRRTIPELQEFSKDPHPTVRMEVARSLVLMGDVQQAPTLIEGLDSDRTEIRYMCHEALKSATGRDFGYDHLSEDRVARQRSVLEWRTWWGDLSGDRFFASTYAKQNGLNQDTGTPAAPMGEIRQDPDQEDTKEIEELFERMSDEDLEKLLTPLPGGPPGPGTTTPKINTLPLPTTTTIGRPKPGKGTGNRS